MSDKVEIVDSIEELNSATYSNDKPNDPTLSVEKTDYVIGEDVDNIADVQAEQGKKNLKKSKENLADFEISDEDYENAMFTFSEVDTAYNEGISKEDKMAFVVWWQTICGKKLEGGFNENYGVDEIEILETKGWKDFISGKLEYGDYKLGDILTNGLEGYTDEIIRDEQNQEERDSFEQNLEGARNTWKEETKRKKALGDTTESEQKYLERIIGDEYSAKSNSNYRWLKNIKKAENYDILGLFQMMKGLDSKTQTSLYEDLKRSWESLAEPNAEGERQFDLLTNLGGGDEEMVVSVWEDVDNALQRAINKRQSIDRIKSNNKQVERDGYNWQSKSTISGNTFDEIQLEINGIVKLLTQFEETLEMLLWNVFPYKVPKSVRQLVESGHLFYDSSEDFNKRFQPKAIFQSGNIYNKETTFNGDNKGRFASKDVIEKEFGENSVKRHREAIDEAFIQVDETIIRFADDDNEGRTIDLKPVSDLCNNLNAFSITKFYSPIQSDPKNPNIIDEPSVWVNKDGVRYTKPVKDRYDKPTQEFQKYNVEDSKNERVLKQMTLAEAFILYLLELTSSNARLYGINLNPTISGSSPSFNVAIYFENKKARVEKLNETGEGTGTFEFAEGGQKVEIDEVVTENIERIFKIFIQKGLLEEDREELIKIWNRNYNSLLEPDLSKVPIGFSYRKYFGSELNTIRPEKLNAIRFWLSRGSVGLAYGVGVGKTWCANFIVAQALDMGLTKQPMFVLPNQVYQQYINEIKNVIKETPSLKIRELYNMSKEYNVRVRTIKRDIKRKKVDKNIIVVTYQALDNLYLNVNKLQEEDGVDSPNAVNKDWVMKQVLILESGDDKTGEEQVRKQLDDVYKTITPSEELKGVEEQTAETIKKVSKGSGRLPVYYNDVDINPDMLVTDEFHNFKALFSSVKGKPLDTQIDLGIGKKDPTQIRRKPNNYAELKEATPSSQQANRAKQLFYLVRYVQTRNNFGNTIFLSATPFTNNPLEVYSMLTYIMYGTMKRFGLGYIYDFYDTYAKLGEEVSPNIAGKIESKIVFTGWVNLIGLQSLIYMAFDKTTQEQEEKLVKRPNKIQLPLKSMLLNGLTIEPENALNQISTNLSYTPLQAFLHRRLQAYLDDPDYKEAKANNPIKMQLDFLQNCRPISTIQQLALLSSEANEGEPRNLALNDGVTELDKYWSMYQQFGVPAHPYYVPPNKKEVTDISVQVPVYDKEGKPVLDKNRMPKTKKGKTDGVLFSKKQTLEELGMMWNGLHDTPVEPEGYWQNDVYFMIEKRKKTQKANARKKAKQKEKKVEQLSLGIKSKNTIVEEGQKNTEGRVFRATNYGKEINLSPYIYKYSGIKTFQPTPQEFIEASPKLDYVFQCIKSIYDYEDSMNFAWGRSGQVIYMPQGTGAFPLICQYAQEYLGLKAEEVGVIYGAGGYLASDKLNKIGDGWVPSADKGKSGLANLFNGLEAELDDEGKPTPIPHSRRVKLLIGTKSITEGINLQKWATGLYNTLVDWNPTDIIQLNGRIWRQGNHFGYVRSVVPLMENSIDVFIFSKLDEKTKRINAIWNRTNSSNEVDTRVFDPKEVLLNLITDPAKLMKFTRDERIKELQKKKNVAVAEYSKYNGMIQYFTDVEDIVQLPKVRTLFSNSPNDTYYTPLFYLYEFIRLVRPDLITMPLIKPEVVDDLKKLYSELGDKEPKLYDDKYELSDGTKNKVKYQQDLKNYNKTIPQDFLNYEPMEMVEMMEVVRSDSKISYPSNYDPNWRKQKIVLRTLRIGDKVTYTDIFTGNELEGEVSLLFSNLKEDLQKKFQEWSSLQNRTKKEIAEWWELDQNQIAYVQLKDQNGVVIQAPFQPNQLDIVEDRPEEEVVVDVADMPDIMVTGAVTNLDKLIDLGLFQHRNSIGEYNLKGDENFKPENNNEERSGLFRLERFAKEPSEQGYFYGVNLLDLFVNDDLAYKSGSKTDNRTSIIFPNNYEATKNKGITFQISNFSTDTEFKNFIVQNALNNNEEEPKGEELNRRIEALRSSLGGGNLYQNFIDKYKTKKMGDIFEIFGGYDFSNYGEFGFTGFGVNNESRSYDTDFVAKVKEFEVVKRDVLDPEGIENLDGLKIIVDEKEAIVLGIDEDIDFTRGDEWASDTISRIKEEKENAQAQGVSTPSTPETRAKEFATPIVEKDGYIYYYGNEYQGITLDQELQARDMIKDIFAKDKTIQKLEDEIRNAPRNSKEKTIAEGKLADRKAELVRSARKGIKYEDIEDRKPVKEIEEVEVISDEILDLMEEYKEVEQTIEENKDIFDEDDIKALQQELLEINETIELLK